MTHRRKVMLAATTALLAGIVACSDSNIAPVDHALDGPWSTGPRLDGLAMVLDLRWTTDSVKGSGTYNVLTTGPGCGGVTLHGQGTVSFAASISKSAIVGRMTFDNGWSPSYTAMLVDSVRIDGAFQSIDAGPCPFGLFKGLVP